MASTTEELTIDQLAQRTGMTVRNIRAHQSRGLLPPPEVRGRTGFYGPDHVARIEFIKEMQLEGYNLDLIRRLLDSAGGESNEVLRFTRAVREPFGDEESQIVDAAELAQRFQSTDPALLERGVQLGLLRPLGDGRYEDVSPRLSRAGEQLMALGMSTKQALDIVARVRRHCDSIAKVYAGVFLDTVWKPFEEADRPEDRWPDVVNSLERLRPLATESLVAIFQLAMTEEVDKTVGRELESESERHGSRRRVRRR
jgi:DNA-binding transcriptional MerR regulator